MDAKENHNVTDIAKVRDIQEVERLTGYAREFVLTYFDKSPVEAGRYARLNISKEDRDKLKPYIDAAFEKSGWKT